MPRTWWISFWPVEYPAGRMGGIRAASAVVTLARKRGAQLEFMVVYIVITAIAVAILYAVIRSAVRAALFDHYKVVRWYEQTGEWRAVEAFWKNEPRDPALFGTDKK
jgi:hypothetical protein